MNTNIDLPINRTRNIGTTISKRLSEIDIYVLSDLVEMTPAVAYKKISNKYPDKHFSLCYYLYSLQGAIMNLHWEDLPAKLKVELKNQLTK